MPVSNFTSEDLAELVVLQRCCWVPEAIINETLDIASLHETHDEVLAWATTCTTLVMREHGRLVGAVRGGVEGDTDWHIGRLMVAPDRAGHGLGKHLLGLIEDLAPPHIERFVLFTGARSERNIRMYQRAGYRLVPTEPGHANGTVHFAKPRV
ncbi:GNAT family N-acetyltransferase [Nocardia pseudobrasiliensis]|uniref:Acetyltransferase (GNAT) family protein n=1 Tax=Nocardia pseudobrasiliensis TaxID=45979 RepID=A0A370I6Y3_9NOCA|nr:GNAT family N-acetyltransferase [Nocardia pseudobrasiliensis]RDI65074.1 acetyltransferase (GNAT) family protein [Nocardia pseudobrasiliensis]